MDFVLVLFILKKVNKHVSFLNVVQIKNSFWVFNDFILIWVNLE